MKREDFLKLPPIHKTEIYKTCADMRTNGLCLEFGVWKGGSINYLADLIKPNRIWGFDSFEGLPEEWDMGSKVHAKGTFHTSLPEVRSNVSLVPGWFTNTLPKFIKECPDIPVALLHIDSDLYSSARYILEELNHKIIPGTVIMFDELCDFTKDQKFYPKWEEGEWKALREWIAKYNRKIKPLFRNEDSRAAILVLQ